MKCFLKILLLKLKTYNPSMILTLFNTVSQYLARIHVYTLKNIELAQPMHSLVFYQGCLKDATEASQRTNRDFKVVESVVFALI